MFFIRKISRSLRPSSKPIVTTPPHHYDDAKSMAFDKDVEEEEHKADEPMITEYSAKNHPVALSSEQNLCSTVSFYTPDNSNVDLSTEILNGSDANSSFYTQVSGELTVKSQKNKIASSQYLTFEQWKDQNIKMVDLLKLDKLLAKQCERYGANMFDSLQAEDQQSIESLQIDQGFSFEEAVLYHFNAARGLKLPEPGKLSRKKSRQSMSSSVLSKDDVVTASPVPLNSTDASINISPISTQSMVATQPLMHMHSTFSISSPQTEPMTEQEVTAAAFYHHAQEKYIEAMEEEGQLRLSIMLSEQEEKCGCNMFDAMASVDDFLTFRDMLKQGLLFEEAILNIYKQKYPSYMTPIHTTAFSNMMQPPVNHFSGQDGMNYNSNSSMYNTFVPSSAPIPFMYNSTSNMSSYVDYSTRMMMPSSFLQSQPQQMTMMMNNRLNNSSFMMEPGFQLHQLQNLPHSQGYLHDQSPPGTRRKSFSSIHRTRNTSQEGQHDNQSRYLASGLYRPGSNSNIQQSYPLQPSSTHNHTLPSGAALFPKSQPPSRISSRQSMMSRSTSSQLNSRSVSFSRSNSSTGNDVVNGSKIPSLEPVRQDSPTRRQINRR